VGAYTSGRPTRPNNDRRIVGVRVRPFHLDVDSLRQNAAHLGARRTVLTHMSPDVLDHADRVEYEVADEGLVLEV